MSEQPVLYAVSTHLTTREPFVFGRSLDEFAKLVAVACVALKLASSDALPVRQWCVGICPRESEAVE